MFPLCVGMIAAVFLLFSMIAALVDTPSAEVEFEVRRVLTVMGVGARWRPFERLQPDMLRPQMDL